MSEKGPLCLGFVTPVLSTLGAEGGVCVGGTWNVTGIPSPTLLSRHSSHGVQGEGLAPHLSGRWMDGQIIGLKTQEETCPQDSGPPIRGLRGCCQLSTAADHVRMNRTMGWRVVWGCVSPPPSSTPGVRIYTDSGSRALQKDSPDWLCQFPFPLLSWAPGLSGPSSGWLAR